MLRVWDVEKMELLYSLGQVHKSPVGTIEIVPYKVEREDEMVDMAHTFWCADWEGEISIWI